MKSKELKEFEVVIEETLTRSVTVLAYDEEDAVNQVEIKYLLEDIVLDSEDMSQHRIFETNTQIN